MAKKAQKSSTAGQNRWESALMQCPFEEETWKPHIQFIVENDRLDEAHITALLNVVKIPLRRRFSYLHKKELMNMVAELGNPKNKKPPKLPQFFEITEIVYGLQNAGQEIPLPLWAKLIKFGLLNIKDEDLKKRENVTDNSKAGKGSGKKRARSKSPGKKGKKTPEVQPPKKEWSTLKKRGEEDKEKKFIDDEPDDGPHHYIFVSGFKKPQLLAILEEIGIFVNGVLKIQSETYNVLRQIEAEKLAEEELDDEAMSRIQIQHDSERKESSLFWKLLPMLLEQSPAVSRLHDCALLEYTVRDILYPSNWQNQDNMIGYGTAIFEDIACKVYDSLDWHRQYANYLTNINLLHVAEFSKEEKSGVADEQLPPPPVTSVSSQQGKRDKFKLAEAPQVAVEDMVPSISPPKIVETRYYQDLMSCVPMESISVSLVMHCMLEQVVATEEDKTPPTEKEKVARTDGIHLALAECISQSLESIFLTNDDEEILGLDFPQYKQKQEEAKEKNRIPHGPVLLHYGDDVSVRTHHLKEFNNFNPKESELSLLHQLPIARLLTSTSVPIHEVCERMSRLHELHRYASTSEKSHGSQTLGVITEKEVDRALELFVFESMNIAETDAEGNVILPELYSELGNSWDDPYTLAARALVSDVTSSTNFEDESEKGLTESSEKIFVDDNTQRKYFSQKRFLNDYVYSETFKTPVLIQMLEEARYAYPCMNTYYNKRDNSTYVIFHYPMNDNFLCKSDWNTSLHSDVGFRNYLEHVAHRITSWTKLEEQKYQAKQIALELEKLAKAAAEQSTPPTTAKKPKSGKNSKKGSRKGSPGGRKGSPSRASSKAGSNEPSVTFSSPFIRSGSLKAENEMQAKAKEEEDRSRKEKESKKSTRKSDRSKSPESKTPTGKDSATKRMKSGKKSPKSRSRSSSVSVEKKESPEVDEEPKEEIPQLPFTGYDVGNNLIHIHGKDCYLNPCDGGMIKVEKIKYQHGQTSVKTTTYKDGHTFVLHILEPMDPKDDSDLTELLAPPEPVKTLQENDVKSAVAEDSNTSPRISSPELLRGKKEHGETYYSLFSSWTGTLCDGMTLSLSVNGPEGINKSAVKAKERIARLLSDIPPASSPTPLPPGMDTPKKGKKGDRSPRSKSPRAKSPKGKKGKDAEKEAEMQRLEELKRQEELEKKLKEESEAKELERRKLNKPRFPQVYTSCPDGLAIRFELDLSSSNDIYYGSDEESKLLVRQSYPYKTSGKQITEKARSKPAMEEVSRSILSDGRVVKIMKDGSSKVLFADGTVCFNLGSGPIVTDNRVPATPVSANSGGSNPQNHTVSEELRVGNSAGSRKGSKGRRSSAKTMEASVTETSTVGTLGVAAGLEVEANAKLEADLENAQSWMTSYMSGEVTVTRANGTAVSQNPLLCFTATDPVTGEVMLTREDSVVRVDRPDGSSICDHADGTRITRFCREEEVEEQAEGSHSVLVWFIRVECPGFASLTFNCSDKSCTASFGSGSTLTSTVDGSYQLLHWNGGRLDITNDGSVMYTPRPNNDLLIAALSNDENGDDKLPASKPEAVGSYLMRHNSDVCCEALDQEGNVFQVKSSGDVNVIRSDSIKNLEENDNAEEEEQKVTINPLNHHPPRLFVIHNDGTGTELLRHKDIQEYIGDAQLDPVTAVICEPLPDNMKVTGITVMRPHFGNSGDAWVMQKEEQNVIPPNLKTRDLTKFPDKEVKKPGLPFATTVGKGLAIGSAPAPVVNPPAPMCPNALELRQLLQHEPVSPAVRRHVTEKVLEYGKAVCEQEKLREEMKIREPRTTEEQMRANDLLKIVLEFDEKNTPRTPEAVSLSNAVVSNQNSVHKFPTVVPDHQDSPSVRIKYEATVAPQPPPKIPPPQPKLTAEDWRMIEREIEEEKLGRIALKNRIVPSYFDSEEGKAWLLTQTSDVEDLQKKLITNSTNDSSKTELYQTAREQLSTTTHESVLMPTEEISTENIIPPSDSMGMVLSDLSSKVRPTNPTPAHAIGSDTPTKVRPDNPTPFKADAQVRNARPSNPTPSHAFGSLGSKSDSGVTFDFPSIPENPSSAQLRERSQTPLPTDVQQPSTDQSVNNTSSSLIPIDTDPNFVITKSLLYDVTGEPRKERVRLPASILSDKPGAVPNERFIRIEEEVRRKVKTASVSSGLAQGRFNSSQRGFQLFPPEVVFGVLREGTTYSCTIKMKNIGIDSCRFKIKQPPPGTGLKVHYKPGPVAAGMDTDLEIEIYAIAVGVEGDSGVGTINHQLEIIAESEILHLPISALVLPAHNFDFRNESMPTGQKAPGVKVSSTKPPLRDGIVRPHKLAS